jgi:hypothetical protein
MRYFHSFAKRVIVATGRHRARERLVFDPGPTIHRRTDVPGGLARRTRKDWYAWELEARLFYYQHVVGHYFPIRYRLLRPLFVLRGFEQSLLWMWDDNRHRSRRERVRATIGLVQSLPRALPFQRFSTTGVRRVSQLSFVPADDRSTGVSRPDSELTVAPVGADGSSHGEGSGKAPSCRPLLPALVPSVDRRPRCSRSPRGSPSEADAGTRQVLK